MLVAPDTGLVPQHNNRPCPLNELHQLIESLFAQSGRLYYVLRRIDNEVHQDTCPNPLH